MRVLADTMRSTPQLRDAYGALLTGVRLAPAFGSGKSVLVTSTQPSEGKTTVACCLAIAAALSGQTVLLIDGDLRQPSLASAAGIRSGTGFGELLDGCVTTADAINRIELFDDPHGGGTLSIIGAGEKTAEFLANVDWPTARKTIRSIAQQFDLVLFDSPPVLAANDALLLARIADAVLLVVGAGSADREEVLRAKEQLEQIGTPLVGAVLNRFDPRIHGRPERPYLGYNLAS